MSIKELPKETGIKDSVLNRSVRDTRDRINRVIGIVGQDRIALGPNAEVVWTGDVTVTIRES